MDTIWQRSVLFQFGVFMLLLLYIILFVSWLWTELRFSYFYLQPPPSSFRLFLSLFLAIFLSISLFVFFFYSYWHYILSAVYTETDSINWQQMYLFCSLFGSVAADVDCYHCHFVIVDYIQFLSCTILSVCKDLFIVAAIGFETNGFCVVVVNSAIRFSMLTIFSRHWSIKSVVVIVRNKSKTT